MNEHLKEISSQVAPGAHAALICDGAGWHQSSEKLCVPDNISLVPLPPYTPKLNPMENVWEYLRANKLCSRVWDTYEAIVQACKRSWDFLITDPDRIRSIGTRDWACVILQGGRYNSTATMRGSDIAASYQRFLRPGFARAVAPAQSAAVPS